MKRKRNSEELQACDLVLTDASGRSVRAHRALLMNKSDYFARVLEDHHLTELQLNENYLIELIHYLYSHDSDYGQPQADGAPLALSPDVLAGTRNHDDDDDDDADADADADHEDTFGTAKPQSSVPPPLCPLVDQEQEDAEMSGEVGEVIPDAATTAIPMDHSSLLTHGDIEVLMRMLWLSKKYSFRQLYRNLINEINYKLGPLTAITVYKSARELCIQEFLDQTRMMILSWISQLQTTEEFLLLSEDSIRDIFDAESPEIESESKLDALSAWWSHNKQADMTDLWVKIMMST